MDSSPKTTNATPSSDSAVGAPIQVLAETPLTSGAPSPLEQRVRQVCDHIGAFVEWWGFKHIHGRVWTLLVLRREPMTQVEIAEYFQVSRSLISAVMAELTRVGLVKPTGEERTAPYQACEDFWPAVTNVLREREWMMLEKIRAALEAATAEAQASVQEMAKSPYDPARFGLLLSMTESAQTLLKILMSIRVPKAFTMFAAWVARASSLLRVLRKKTKS